MFTAEYKPSWFNVCLSFTIYFFSCIFLLLASCFLPVPDMKEGCRQWGREHQKEARTISNSTAPRVRAHVFLQGGPTCHGSRKAEQTQLPLSLLFVHARSVFVCVGVCNTNSWRRMEDVLYVSLDLHEHSLDNGTDQKHSVTETLSHTELTPTHHVNHIFP